jgi:DNA-directed RNA polymerase subunit RPC12/RpoP
MDNDLLPPDEDARITFRCPQCQKTLQAPAALAGKQTRCPQCQMLLKVPLHSTPKNTGEDYPVNLGDGPSAAEQQRCVLVICPVCNARMHPPESQIGQKIACPDCGTATIVRRPPEQPPKKPPRTPDEVGEYPLSPGAGRPAAPIPAAEQDYIPVPCSLCHTRMMATADQVGQWLVCPDCGTLTVVPPMPPKVKKIDVMAGAGDGYRLAGYVPPSPSAAASEPFVRPTVVDEPREPDPRFAPRRKRAVLPPHPFLDGTFTFPFSPNVIVRTAVLAVWAMLPLILFLFGANASRVENPVTWLACAMLVATAAVILVLWYFVFCATLMTVFRETSEGCDTVEWPGPVFLDWIGEALWLFLALSMSAVPGGAVSWLFGLESSPMGMLIASVGMFFAFPFVLMSMLESNTVIGIVSWPVMRTYYTATAGWLKFYFLTAVLVAGVSCIVWCASWVNLVFGGIVGAFLQAYAWIVYFRLLGRLAWYFTARSAVADLEEALDEVLEEDEFDEETAEARLH